MRDGTTPRPLATVRTFVFVAAVGAPLLIAACEVADQSELADSGIGSDGVGADGGGAADAEADDQGPDGGTACVPGEWVLEDQFATPHDSSVAVMDATGAIHMAVDGDTFDHVVRSPQGEWSREVIFNPGGGGDSVNGRPTGIAVDSTGGVHVVSTADINPEDVTYSYKPPGGVWSSPVDVKPAYDTSAALAIDSDDVLHIIHVDDGDIWHTWRALDGIAWSSEEVDDTTFSAFSRPALAIDEDDGLHIAYREEFVFGEDDVVRYAHKPKGGAWVKEDNGMADVKDVSDIAVAGDGQGHAHVAYIPSSFGAEDRLMHAIRSGDGAWDIAPTSDNASIFQDGIELVMDAAGGVSWLFPGDGGSSDVRIAYLPVGASQWTSEMVPFPGTSYDLIEGPDGALRVLLWDSNDDVLRLVARCP